MQEGGINEFQYISVRLLETSITIYPFLYHSQQQHRPNTINTCTNGSLPTLHQSSCLAAAEVTPQYTRDFWDKILFVLHCFNALIWL